MVKFKRGASKKILYKKWCWNRAVIPWMSWIDSNGKFQAIQLNSCRPNIYLCRAVVIWTRFNVDDIEHKQKCFICLLFESHRTWNIRWKASLIFSALESPSKELITKKYCLPPKEFTLHYAMRVTLNLSDKNNEDNHYFRWAAALLEKVISFRVRVTWEILVHNVE